MTTFDRTTPTHTPSPDPKDTAVDTATLDTRTTATPARIIDLDAPASDPDPIPPRADRAGSTSKVTFPKIVRSEWLKFRTARANVYAIVGAAAAAIGLGALFSSLAGSDDGPGRLAQDALSLSLGGFQLSQIIIAILGVALVAGEYQTGLIRSWFAAAPDRLRILAAKVTVYGGIVFAVSLVAAVLAFLAGQALLPAGWEALTLTSDGVGQALVGTAFYAACIGIIGLGLGFLLRSTAAGAGAVVSILMIAPLLVSLLPDSIGDPLGKILPSNAASAVQGVSSNVELLSAGGGIAVLLGWVVVIVGAAAISLKRRDA